MNVKYSIITPVFNRADCIGRCIESVIRNLNYNLNIEHIIVDDGSNDDSVSIVEQYKNKFNHIKFIRFIENKGPNAARNAAINMASGTFCILLDSDDYFIEDAIKKINDLIERYSYDYYLCVRNTCVPYIENNDLLKGCKIKLLHFIDFLRGEISGDFVHIIKTSLLKSNPFDEQCRIYESVFLFRIYKEIQNIFFMNEVITICDRKRTDSVIRSNFRSSKIAIAREIRSLNLWLDWFANDCIENELYYILISKYKRLFEDYLLLEDYVNAKKQFDVINSYDDKNIQIHLKIIYYMHLGGLFRNMIKIYQRLKYDIMKKSLRYS